MRRITDTKSHLEPVSRSLNEKLKNKTFREAYEHYHEALSVGLKIKAVREHAGLTQKQVADRMGVSQQVVSRLESGEVDNPTIDTLARLAKVTGRRLRVEFA